MDILGFISALFLFCSIISFLVVIFLIGYDDLRKQRELKERVLKCIEDYEKIFKSLDRVVFSNYNYFLYMKEFVDSVIKSKENISSKVEVSDNE